MALPPPGHDPGALGLGVRPETIRLHEAGVPARVVAVEYLGADTLIEARIGAHPVIIRRPGRANAQAGETVHLSWSAADVHWFDLSSDRRIDTR